MVSYRYRLRMLAPVLAASLGAPTLSARPNGFASECGGCHYGQLDSGGMTPTPEVTAVAAASRVEAGEQVEITVNVRSMWPDARVAGFLIMGEEGAGAFVPAEEGTGNVGIAEGEMLSHTIGHTAARELIDGTATFRATWTAPTAPAGYAFDVYAVTSDDGDGMDDPDVSEEINDSMGKFELQIGVGCDLVTYFFDGDGDGYGGQDERAGCEPPPGYVAQGGDCRDDDPAVNPGAVELCSFVDEDCDGEAMAPLTFYRDIDGDGYGEVSDIRVDTCTLPDGYAEQAGDCEPNDPTIHPGAIDVVGNALDDDCDGTTDESSSPDVAEPLGGPAVPTTMPAGSPSSGGLDPATGDTAPVTTVAPVMTVAPVVDGLGPTDDGSAEAACSVTYRRRSGVGSWAGLALCCAVFVRRRAGAWGPRAAAQCNSSPSHRCNHAFGVPPENHAGTGP